MSKAEDHNAVHEPVQDRLGGAEPCKDHGLLMKTCSKSLTERFSRSQSKRSPRGGNLCLVGGATEAQRVEMNCLEQGQVV